ncbi:hypothetical protein [Chelativorans alearense]|uniref:hypothetical protein n=1 Tax=Chelativorans alearense TaxID=2681495 RepID=UPI0013D8A28D|nr:hypothetical protein [Chelativorans alearense]
MRKILLATSALALLGAGASYAQVFEPSNMDDEPVPDVVETQDVDTDFTTGAVESEPLVPFFPNQVDAADGFKPSDANDSPTPDIVQDDDLGGEGITTGAMTWLGSDRDTQY